MGTIKFKNMEENVNEELASEEILEESEGQVYDEVALKKNKDAPIVLFEDEAKREENVKHFRMSDGSYRAQIFTEPVHYYDETEGKYLAIDNTLCDCPACLEKEDDFDGYENRQSDVRVKFGKRTNGKLFTLEKDGYKVEWKLLGKRDKRLLCDALNDSCAFLPNGKQRSAETKLSDEIRYNDIAPGTDLQYILSPKRIKENIIVRESQDFY